MSIKDLTEQGRITLGKIAIQNGISEEEALRRLTQPIDSIRVTRHQTNLKLA